MLKKLKSLFPPAPLTMTAWREPFVWNEELQEALRNDIRKLEPKTKISILFLGAMAAGKSSLVNSFLSVIKDRKVDIAQTGSAPTSFTLKYEEYTSTTDEHYSLRDCRGIEPTWTEGYCEEDIMRILKGHIKPGHQFQPAEVIKEDSKFYRKHPEFEHQIHCAVYVVDIKVIDKSISPEYIQNIKSLQKKVRELGIPRVLVLTKVDTFCNEVGKDISKLFYSVKVRDAVRLASEIFNLPEASIHPVKNYEHEIELNMRKNITILLAVRQILQYADDRITKEETDKKERAKYESS